MGEPDVDKLLSRITSAQFTEWIAFWELEPFGPLRDDLRAGTTASAVANSAPFRAKGAKSLRPADFFSSLKPPLKVQTAEEMVEAAKSFVRRAGGQIKTIPRR